MTEDLCVSVVGKQIPAADGGNYGLMILGYHPAARDFIVVPIKWMTGEELEPQNPPRRIDCFKASYRYVLGEARLPMSLTRPRSLLSR